MSLLLFNLYVQDLIQCLDRKGMGWYMAVMANLFDPACKNLIFLRVPLFLMVMD